MFQSLAKLALLQHRDVSEVAHVPFHDKTRLCLGMTLSLAVASGELLVDARYSLAFRNLFFSNNLCRAIRYAGSECSFCARRGITFCRTQASRSWLREYFLRVGITTCVHQLQWRRSIIVAPQINFSVPTKFFCPIEIDSGYLHQTNYPIDLFHYLSEIVVLRTSQFQHVSQCICIGTGPLFVAYLSLER